MYREYGKRADYLAPGIYVKQAKSAYTPIAGVGTSTAGFIGVVKNTIDGGERYSIKIEQEKVGTGYGVQGKLRLAALQLANYPVLEKGQFQVTVAGKPLTEKKPRLENKHDQGQSFLLLESDGLIGDVLIDYELNSVPQNDVKLCTKFSDFTNDFGGFATKSPGQNILAHAVYGFFYHGGSRCYVVWIDDVNKIDSALTKFEEIDEIAIVAAPGITDGRVLDQIEMHCRKMGDRFAIFDGPKCVDPYSVQCWPNNDGPKNSDYAALYYPWIKVVNPPNNPKPKRKDWVYAPPSGHIAGIYARVDAQRGVHKAPANEIVFGAIDLQYKVTKEEQEELNPKGINCIRYINGQIRVWGARTLGDANEEFKYINVRRLFLFLCESIEEGTQWIVFEPNAPDLWAAIRRNVNVFLNTIWQNGALVGDAPEQAFFVKCDEETNPPDVRDLGQVITQIGVAIVRPAEFLIFEISHWQSLSST